MCYIISNKALKWQKPYLKKMSLQWEIDFPWEIIFHLLILLQNLPNR